MKYESSGFYVSLDILTERIGNTSLPQFKNQLFRENGVRSGDFSAILAQILDL
jgi:hypothetical protein